MKTLKKNENGKITLYLCRDLGSNMKIAGEYIDAYNAKIDNLSKTEKTQLSILSGFGTIKLLFFSSNI